MDISLSPELEKLIKDKVSSGLYSSASELMSEALHLLEERDQLQASKLDNLRPNIHEGLQALDAKEGKSLDIEAIKQKGRLKLKASTALQALESFLKPRIEAAENGELSSKSIDDIFSEVELSSKK